MKFKFKLKNIISSRIYCGPGMLVVISSILAGRVKKDSLRDWHSCGRVVVNDCNSCGPLLRLAACRYGGGDIVIINYKAGCSITVFPAWYLPFLEAKSFT